MLLEGIVSFKCRLMHVQLYAQLMKKQKENSHEGITWSEMGKQNVQAKEVYCVYKPQKVRTPTEFEAMTSRFRCDAPTN